MSTNDLRLGKFGKQGQVDLENQQLAKGGVRREEIEQQFQNIFDAFDSDGNHVLTQNEISNMKSNIHSYANHGKDSIFSDKEAEKMIENNSAMKQNNVTAENLFNFLQNIESKVKNSNVTESKVDKDGNAAVTVAEGNKDVTKTYSKANGKDVLETVTVEKDESGNPKSKTVVKDGLKETYTYINGKECLTQKIENEGTADEKITEIKYDDQGQQTGETVTTRTSEETKELVNGELKTTHKIENKNDATKRKETTIKYTENGRTETISDHTGTTTVEYIGDNRVKTTKNGVTTDVTTNSDGGKTEVITNDKNDNTTTNVLNKDNQRLSQKKTVNGKEYNLSYDGQGNITGVIVQYGENIDAICKKFGCTKEEFLEANKDVVQTNSKGKQYLPTGASIKIPDKQYKLEADSKVFKGRKDAEGAKAEEQKAIEIKRQRAAKIAQMKAQKKEAAKQREAQYKQMGLINHKNRGKPITGTWKGGRKQEFRIIGQAMNGRTLAYDPKSGKTYTIAHDGVILKESYVQTSNAVTRAKKAGKTQKINGKDYMILGNRPDGHGRKIGMDMYGRQVVISHDGKILKSSYVQRSDTSDAIKKDKNTAKRATIDMLTSQVSSAEAAFNHQLSQDGWAGDVADGISVLWGSENRASKVREDMKAYKQGLRALKNSKNDAEFQRNFYNMFSVRYNAAAIAEYQLHPTDANYRKAFGTKNNIGARVSKYNESQQQGAAIVKTTAKIGAGIAIGVATGGTGLVALGAAAVGTAAASAAIEESDRFQVTGQYTDANGNTVNAGYDFKAGTDHGQIFKDAAFDGASVFVGGVVGKGAKYLVKGKEVFVEGGKSIEQLTRAQKFERFGVTVVGDTTTGAALEYAQTGDVTLEGTLSNAVMSGVGSAHELGAFKAIKNRFTHKNNNSPSTVDPSVMDHATGDGSHITGGKLNDEKFNLANQQTGEIAHNGSVTDVADAYHEADLHQVQNRKQGKKLKQTIERGGEFSTVDGRRIPQEGNARSAEIVEQINQNVAQSADNILKGKQGGITPHDAATLKDHIANNLDTPEDLDKFITDLKKRVGTYTDGAGKEHMQVYEVQGKDHAAEVLKLAEQKQKTLLAHREGLNGAMSGIDEAIKNKRGLTNDEFAKIKAFAQETNSADELQSLIDKMSNNKNIMKSSASKKLVSDMKAKKAQLEAQPKKTETSAEPKAQVKEEPTKKPAEEEPAVDPKKQEELQNKADEIKQNVDELDASIPPAMKHSWENLKNDIQKFFNKLKAQNINFASLKTEGKALLDKLEQFGKNLSNAAKTKIENIKNSLKETLDSLKSDVEVVDATATESHSTGNAANRQSKIKAFKQKISDLKKELKEIKTASDNNAITGSDFRERGFSDALDIDSELSRAKNDTDLDSIEVAISNLPEGKLKNKLQRRLNNKRTMALFNRCKDIIKDGLDDKLNDILGQYVKEHPDDSVAKMLYDAHNIKRDLGDIHDELDIARGDYYKQIDPDENPYENLMAHSNDAAEDVSGAIDDVSDRFENYDEMVDTSGNDDNWDEFYRQEEEENLYAQDDDYLGDDGMMMF